MMKHVNKADPSYHPQANKNHIYGEQDVDFLYSQLFWSHKSIFFSEKERCYHIPSARV